MLRSEIIFTNALGGTTDFIYSGAAGDMLSPGSNAAVDGARYTYRAQSFDGSQWEVGSGLYTASSGTFARTAVYANSSGTTAKIDFSTPPSVTIYSYNTEGFWTPTLTFATPGDLAVTYGTQRAWYERIGRSVFAHVHIQTSAFTWTTASGNLLISGLPFTANSFPSLTADSARNGGIQFQGINKAGYSQLVPSAEAGSTNCAIRASGMGVAAANVVAADMPSGGTVLLRFGIGYSTAA